MVDSAQLVHVPQRSQALTIAGEHTDSQLKKWGIATKAGFQVVPNVLFRAQQHLGIDCVDVVILLNLSLHWWGSENLPFPTPALMAQRMGISKRTIERRIQNLQKRGFINRLPARALADGKPKVRKFDLSGLVEKLESAALVGLAKRQFAKSIKQSGL